MDRITDVNLDSSPSEITRVDHRKLRYCYKKVALMKRVNPLNLSYSLIRLHTFMTYFTMLDPKDKPTMDNLAGKYDYIYKEFIGREISDTCRLTSKALLPLFSDKAIVTTLDQYYIPREVKLLNNKLATILKDIEKTEIHDFSDLLSNVKMDKMNNTLYTDYKSNDVPNIGKDLEAFLVNIKNILISIGISSKGRILSTSYLEKVVLFFDFVFELIRVKAKDLYKSSDSKLLLFQNYYPDETVFCASSSLFFMKTLGSFNEIDSNRPISKEAREVINLFY